MTTRLSHLNKSTGKFDSQSNSNDPEQDRAGEAAILHASLHPYHNPRQHAFHLSAAHPFNAARMSGVLPCSSADDQQGALLRSHVGIPPEITDSIQSWVDVQECIDEAMRESPVPKGCLSVGSSVGARGTVASSSGAATPSSLARLSFLHPSSERLLQAVDSPTQQNSPSMVLLQSPVFLDSPGLLSVHSQSPPPEEQEEEEEEEEENVESKPVKNSLILERMVYDRVNAAAACLNSQVKSGVIESDKVIAAETDETEKQQQQQQPPPKKQRGNWSLHFSSRPEVTPPKEAQYSHTQSKQKGRAHRKTHPSNFTDALLLRLEVFSAENFPVLFVSHACSVLLGAALMFLYVKRR